MDSKDVEVTEQAAGVIAKVGEHIDRMQHALGDTNPLASTTAGSWARAMGRTFGLLGGGGRLTRDDDLSLYGVTAYGMHFGVIFFRYQSFDGARPDPKDWTTVRTCAAHKGVAWEDPDEPCPMRDADSHCYPLDIPVPGEWSLHS
jgi:hypothetical protein